MLMKTSFGLLLFFCSQLSMAQEIQKPQCQNQTNSLNEILKCAEESSPEVNKARLELLRAKSQIAVARQWKNPELSANSVFGPPDSELASETELTIGVPIEFGGKISAHTRLAQSAVAHAEAQLVDARTRVRNELTLKLHRLRQLLHEEEVVNESIGTFTKLIAQYAGRPKLSPEQEASETVFRMSKSEYDLKKVELDDEYASINARLLLQLGVGVDAVKNALPESPRTWPTPERQNDLSASPRLQSANADLQAAEAERAVANSDAWPTLTLGPSLKLQAEGGRSDAFFGFNISLQIPLFHTNGASKEAASAGVRLAEVSRTFARTELERTRDELIRTYRQSVSVLATTLSHDMIEKKHAGIERLFLRGIVPSSLVIEAHRTFVDLEKTRNERELKAINALLSLAAIDGKDVEI